MNTMNQMIDPVHLSLHAARRLGALVMAVLVLFLAGCTAPQPAVYQAETPKLELRDYFNGRLDAWGIFQDRSGKVVRRFTVDMKAHWKGDVGTLEEDFVYSDGKRERRVWTLRRTAPGRYVGTADDVIGEAQGVVAGNALHWRYTLALPVDGTTYHFDFDDWMFLVDDRVMLNRAVMSKFGVRLGEVTLSFTKRP
ncbi:MAG: hypothetical protein RL322_2508 [Pseudomonadota bacterium]